jgi:hypothetical protein
MQEKECQNSKAQQSIHPNQRLKQVASRWYHAQFGQGLTAPNRLLGLWLDACQGRDIVTLFRKRKEKRKEKEKSTRD